MAEVVPPRVWAAAGSYFEACNCEAICPCRQVGGRAGGRPVYGICQFALSWQIDRGHAGELRVDDLAVVMAGWYDDDEPGLCPCPLFRPVRNLGRSFVPVAPSVAPRRARSPLTWARRDCARPG
jgi:hypothetical protein